MADEDNTEVDLDGLLEDSVRDGEDFPTDDVIGGDVDDLLDDIIGLPDPSEVEDEAEVEASESGTDKYEAPPTAAAAEEEEPSEAAAPVEVEDTSAAAVVEAAEPEPETPETPMASTTTEPPSMEAVAVEAPTPVATQDKENTPNATTTTQSPPPKSKSKPTTPSTAASSTMANKKKKTTTRAVSTPAKRTPAKPKTTPTPKKVSTPKPRTTTITPKPKKVYTTDPTPKKKTPTRRVPGPKSPKRPNGEDDEDDDDVPQGPICDNVYQTTLHARLGPCQICVFKLNEKEKVKFEHYKRHLGVNSTRGGCACCKAFPSQEGEDPVRICRQCFFDTHKLAAPKYAPFEGRKSWPGLPAVQPNGKFVL